MMRLMAPGEPPSHFTFPPLTGLGVPHVTTSRHCGAIGPCCYEADARVIAALAAAYPERWRAWATTTARAGHFMLDLWAANTTLLTEAGLDPGRIENPRMCTACGLDTFYSYRKGHRG